MLSLIIIYLTYDQESPTLSREAHGEEVGGENSFNRTKRVWKS